MWCSVLAVTNLGELGRKSPPTKADQAKRDEDEATIGANIARLRKEAGLSQTALAEAMRAAGHDWHQNTVSRVENGRQRLDVGEMEDLAQIIDGNFLAGTHVEETMRRLARTVVDRAVERRLKRAEVALAQASEALSELRHLIEIQGRGNDEH